MLSIISIIIRSKIGTETLIAMKREIKLIFFKYKNHSRIIINQKEGWETNLVK